jgi:hypothetical protein
MQVARVGEQVFGERRSINETPNGSVSSTLSLRLKTDNRMAVHYFG